MAPKAFKDCEGKVPGDMKEDEVVRQLWNFAGCLYATCTGEAASYW